MKHYLYGLCVLPVICIAMESESTQELLWPHYAVARQATASFEFIPVEVQHSITDYLPQPFSAHDYEIYAAKSTQPLSTKATYQSCIYSGCVSNDARWCVLKTVLSAPILVNKRDASCTFLGCEIPQIASYSFNATNHLLLGEIEGGIKIWDVVQNKECGSIFHGNEIISDIQSPIHNAALCAIAVGGAGLSIWDVETKKYLYRYCDMNSGADRIVYSADGQLLAANWYNGMVTVHDLRQKNPIMFSAKGRFMEFNRGLSFNASSTVLCVQMGCGMISVYDMRTLSCDDPYTFPHKNQKISNIFCIGDAALGLQYPDGHMEIRDIFSAKKLNEMTLPGYSKTVYNQHAQELLCANTSDTIQTLNFSAIKDKKEDLQKRARSCTVQQWLLLHGLSIASKKQQPIALLSKNEKCFASQHDDIKKFLIDKQCVRFIV